MAKPKLKEDMAAMSDMADAKEMPKKMKKGKHKMLAKPNC
jgi:hypothetical protein